MPTADDISIAIARTYATALLNAAEGLHVADALLEEMQAFLAYLDEDVDFARFLYSPAVDDDARRRILDKVFRGRLSDLFLNALQVMNDKGRLSLLPVMCEEYRLGLEARRDEVDVHVTTAVPLPDRLRPRLESVAGAIAGRRARLVEKVDPSMIGGLVVRIEDEKYDATVSRKLRQIRDALVDRAAREIHGGKHYFEEASV